MKIENQTPATQFASTGMNQIIGEMQNYIISAGLTPNDITSLTGTSSSSGTTITGVGTLFLTEVKIGDLFYKDSAEGYSRRVTSITNDLSLTTESSFDSEFSGVACSVFDVTQMSQARLRTVGKYFGYGFIPRSGSNSDEEVTIEPGDMLCEDGSTYVTLDSVETDLNLATVKGSVLSNSATVSLWRYLKSDDTMQWHAEEDTLTPTIGDIKSAKAYRLVCTAFTNASGDIIKFHSSSNGGVGLIITPAIPTNGFIGSPSTSEATLTLPVPKLVKLRIQLSFLVKAISAGGKQYRIYSPDSDDVALTDANATMYGGVGGDISDTSSEPNIMSNALGQIKHKAESASGTLYINVTSYEFFRNDY